jgi:tetratricopeptide (TPR) repeat protein
MQRLNFRTLTALVCLYAVSMAYGQTKPDALELYRKGDFNTAIDVCIAEIGENPSNTESHVVLCWSLVEAKRYEEAEKWAEKGRVLSKYDPRLIEIQAEAKYFRGINDQALKLFQEYISYAPNGSRIAPTYFFMGEIYIRQAKFRHADIAFSSALQLEGMNAAWWVRLAYAREMAKDYRYSLDAYTKALELNGTLQDAVRGRDRVLKQLD